MNVKREEKRRKIKEKTTKIKQELKQIRHGICNNTKISLSLSILNRITHEICLLFLFILVSFLRIHRTS